MPQHHFDDAYGADAPANYERYFVPVIGRPIATDLVERARLAPGERVLDVGCGTGIVARLAAPEVGETGSVTGVDVNPGMLDAARRSGPESIVWREANATELPFDDRSFDVVLCQMSLQFFSDARSALAEMERVLVPAGRLLVNLPGPIAPVFEVMATAFGQHVAPQAAGFVKRVFSIHDWSELRSLISGAGFTNVAVDEELVCLELPPPRDFLWQYVASTPLAPMVRDVDDAALEKLEEEVASAWSQFEVDQGMEYDQRMLTGRGRKRLNPIA